MHSKFTAIILSGGNNSRMQGKNKSFLKLGDSSFLEHLLHTLSPLFSQILLVTREPHLYTQFNIDVISDKYTKQCSLTGIHAGLSQAVYKHAFVTACDTPLLKRELVSLLLEETTQRDDVVVPKQKCFYEPLCAVYSKDCIQYIEKMLSENNLKISDLYKNIRLKEITEKWIETADPGQESFVNINTPQDLKWLNSLY